LVQVWVTGLLERKGRRKDRISAGAKGKMELYGICNELYISGEWPVDFLDSVIITIQKKHGIQHCVDFRVRFWLFQLIIIIIIVIIIWLLLLLLLLLFFFKPTSTKPRA